MQATSTLKRLLYPSSGGLQQLRFREGNEELSALVPAQERFGLVRELLLQRIYEQDGLGDTVVDAGANVGLFSLIASRHARQVIALEAQAINYRVLEMNLLTNEIENVTPLHSALWREDGKVECVSPSDGRQSACTTQSYVADHGREDLKARTVDAITLDTLVSRYGPIDLLKLDIEGAEEEVLPTTSALKDVKRIVAELHLFEDGQEQPMVVALRDQGFEVQVIPSSDLYTPNWLPNVLRNFSCLDGEFLVKLGLIAYLLAPITKPRRPGRDMPLLMASRH